MIHAKAVSFRCFLLLALVSAWAAPSIARADGDVNFFLGQKFLDKGDWDPVYNQPELGAEITFGKKGWPVQIAIDVLASADEQEEQTFFGGITFKGSTSELGVGVRKVWEPGKSRPYIGGGIALVYGKFEGEQFGVTISDTDSVAGAWVGGGIFWRLGPAFNLGLSARYSKATVTFFGIDGEGGGAHLGLLLGWGWPAGK